jgi:hypothetical protein
MQSQSSKTGGSSETNSRAKFDQFKIETGHDSKRGEVAKLRNLSIEKKLTGVMGLKEKKKLEGFERNLIKDQVNTTVNQIEKIKRNFSSKSSFTNLTKFLTKPEKEVNLGKSAKKSQPKRDLSSFWDEARRRNFEQEPIKVKISGQVQKEIERRLKHKKKLEEAIDLFNQKPKKGYLELLQVNPIYHAKREIAMRNLTKFLFSSEKISKKK